MDDLLIIGAGPCGLGSAIYARSKGLKVCVLDSKSGVIDKACGEGVMPGGVKLLHSLGVEIPRYRPFKGIRYLNGKQHADGFFPQGEGWGVRRTVLHQALLERARDVGVTITQHRVKSTWQTTDLAYADDFYAPYIIAADGLRSPTRRRLNLELQHHSPNRYGLRRHFAIKPWTDFVEVYWSRYAEAYVTPVDENLVGVAILFGDELREKLSAANDTDKSLKFYARALAEFPELNMRCINPASTIRGAGPFKTVLSKQQCGRILLAGDAAGYLDPITGEGIRLGLKTGMAAVDAISSGNVDAYSRNWQKSIRAYWSGTSALLWLRRQEVLRKLMIPTLKAIPPLFSHILARIDQ